MTERVKRGDWKHEPASEPVPIPAPDRIWPDDEMDRIRLGLLAESRDDKWFAYMEDNQLYMHRSRHELLDRTLIWNQRQLERLLEEFVEHYNQHRPHRSLNQRAPADSADASVIELGQPIQRTTTCAGLINEYQPAA